VHAQPSPPVSAARVIAANELAWNRWLVAGSGARESGRWPPPVGEQGHAGTWLRGRGIDPARAAETGWRLGWAGPEWHATAELLAQHGVPLSTGIAAGLIRRPDPQRPAYDAFRSRIIVPVRSITTGRVLGFTARHVEEGRQGRPGDPPPKYINSPGNRAYAKSRTLLGAWEARCRNAREPLRGLVLVEGPVDAINVSCTGPWAGVAPCGTALTAPQAEWLAALSATLRIPVVIAYDGDDAGRTAGLRAWDLLEPLLMENLRYAELPEGRDPGDLGGDDLREILQPRLRYAEPPEGFDPGGGGDLRGLLEPSGR
jgi:DNA primase